MWQPLTDSLFGEQNTIDCITTPTLQQLGQAFVSPTFAMTLKSCPIVKIPHVGGSHRFRGGKRTETVVKQLLWSERLS